MPGKKWKFLCGCQNKHTLFSYPECKRCGAQGVFDGWHLRMFEAMSAYIKVFGLKPMGYHRDFAGRVMGPLFWSCEVCDGKGTVALSNDEGWLYCPLCNGTQLVPKVPQEQIDRARQLVLTAFPSAGYPDAQAGRDVTCIYRIFDKSRREQD